MRASGDGRVDFSSAAFTDVMCDSKSLMCEVCWTVVCVSCCRDSRWWWDVARDDPSGRHSVRPRLGIPGPFGGCHGIPLASADLGSKACLQALTLHSQCMCTWGNHGREALSERSWCRFGDACNKWVKISEGKTQFEDTC